MSLRYKYNFFKTSHSLTNVMLYLSANQDKQEILYQELKKLLPDPSTPITNEILNEMKYLRACVRESMRFYQIVLWCVFIIKEFVWIRLTPIMTGNARVTQKEVVLSNYKIPAGVNNTFITTLKYLFRLPGYRSDGKRLDIKVWRALHWPKRVHPRALDPWLGAGTKGAPLCHSSVWTRPQKVHRNALRQPGARAGARQGTYLFIWLALFENFN